MTTLAELNADVRQAESTLAPGSETAMLSHYNERMRQVLGAGHTGLVADDPMGDETIVPDTEAAWWRAAYALYEAEPDCDDLQGMYDRVEV